MARKTAIIKNKTLQKIIGAIFGFILLLIVASVQLPATPNSTTPVSYAENQVVEVVDGDTLKAMIDGQVQTVRFLGMNTPETVDPRKSVECYGPEASANTKKLLSNQVLKFVEDPSQGDKDKYGRLLRYIYLPDGTLVNDLLIQEGFAFEYTYDKAFEFQKQFRDDQATAKAKHLGIWSSACDYINQKQKNY